MPECVQMRRAAAGATLRAAQHRESRGGETDTQLILRFVLWQAGGYVRCRGKLVSAVLGTRGWQVQGRVDLHASRCGTWQVADTYFLLTAHYTALSLRPYLH